MGGRCLFLPSAMLRPQAKTSVFVYIYTTMLTLCIYSTYTVKSSTYYYLFAHRFVKGLHLFLILCYSGVHRDVNADSSYFDGPTDWNATNWLEKRRSVGTLTGSDYDKHNFVTFLFLF